MIAQLLSMMVLAFAVSVDGFGVGVTYGLRKIRIPIVSVVIIACCSGLIIWMSMQAGEWLGGLITETAAKLTGAGILIAIGCWALVQLKRGGANEEADGASPIADSNGTAAGARAAGLPIAESEEAAAAVVPMQVVELELKRLGLVIQILRKPQAADVDRSGTISPSEAVMLGVALSLDAFGAGLGAGMLGLPALLTALVIAASGAMFIIVGTMAGRRLSERRNIHALSLLPGILLIAIGILKLL